MVLDHGDIESQEKNKKFIAESTHNVAHLSFAEDVDLRSVLVAGLESVDSDFVSIFPDDDIPNIQGIETSIQYLRSNSLYVAAQGYVLSFIERQSHLFIQHVEDFVPSFVGDDPLKRLLALSRRYQPVFHAVYRTEVLKWSHSRLNQLSTTNIMFQEFFQASLVALRGNIARVPAIFMLRRRNDSFTDRRRLHCPHQLIDSPVNLASDYMYFRDRLLDCFYQDSLGEESIISRRDATRIVDLIHMLFLGRHFDGSYVEYELHKILAEPGRSYFDALKPEHQDIEPESAFREISGQDKGKGIRVFVHQDLLKIADENSTIISQRIENTNEITITKSDIDQLAERIRLYKTSAV
jgi:glycosyltransferase domain-containing protein